MVKDILKKLAGNIGYVIRSTKYIPSQFVEDNNVLKITLDHVLSSHLVKMKDPGRFFFIQVGAFDGMECDPLYHYIVQYGWKGILLEPQPQAFQKLSQLHASRAQQLHLVNAALAHEEKKSVFYILEGDDLPSWAQGMASFDRGNIVKHRDIIPDIDRYVKETTIDCITFRHLFNRFQVDHIDLLQVDTEGFDAEIIYMFPFEKIKPAIIHFESKHLVKPKLEKLLSYLIGMNYSVAYDGAEDMLAVHNR